MTKVNFSIIANGSDQSQPHSKIIRAVSVRIAISDREYLIANRQPIQRALTLVDVLTPQRFRAEPPAKSSRSLFHR